MPLYKSLVPVTFSGGLDQKTPEKLSVPGTFLNLENIVRRKSGQLEKRPGYTDMSRTYSTSGTVDSGDFLTVLGDELVTFGDEGKVFSYSDTEGKQVFKGWATLCGITSDPAVRDGEATGFFDVAYGGGYACVVWEKAVSASSTS